MNYKKHLKKYAEEELKRIGFNNTPFGDSCLDFLDKCADIVDSDTDSMKNVILMLLRIIDTQPLSPITEEDFEVEIHPHGDKTVEILRCTRYPYVYKKDGKYYDDRAVAFVSSNNKNNKMYLYQSGHCSKKEIELPYFPVENIEYLN